MFNVFIKDLDLSERVKESLSVSRTDEELKIFALSLPDLENPDTYILAGRILIYINIKTCPKKIKDYVEILSNILNKKIKNLCLVTKNKLIL